jgi:hypothetical protein
MRLLRKWNYSLVIVGAVVFQLAGVWFMYKGGETNSLKEKKVIAEMDKPTIIRSNLSAGDFDSILFDFNNVHSSRHSRRPRFILGIMSNHRKSHAKTRQTLRDTYLSFYQNNIQSATRSKHTICSLNEYLRHSTLPTSSQRMMSKIHSDCQIAYTFIFSSNSSTPLKAVAEPDATIIRFFDSSNKLTNGGKRAMTLAWFQYAASLAEKLQFDYIAKVDSNLIIFPELLLDLVSAEKPDAVQIENPPTANATKNSYPRSRGEASTGIDTATNVTPNNPSAHTNDNNNLLVYGGTPFDKLEKYSVGGFYSYAMLGEESGRFSFVSPALAKYIVANLSHHAPPQLSGQDDSVDDDADLEIQTLALEHPDGLDHFYKLGWYSKQNPNNFHSIWNQHQHSFQKWNNFTKTWNTSVEYVTAKFHRHNKFAHVVALKKQSLVSEGLHPRQIHTHDEFPDFILRDPRWTEHLGFLQNTSLSERGAGYWFWKPVLIQHYLKKLENGDFLVYRDADTVALKEMNWGDGLLQAMMERNHDLALYLIPFKERQFNKRDVYEYYCPLRNQSKDDSLQWLGGWIVLRKSPASVQLMNDWVQGVQDFHFINDAVSRLPNIPDYLEHRHDQSIISLLVQCRLRMFHNRERFVHKDIHRSMKVYTLRTQFKKRR